MLRRLLLVVVTLGLSAGLAAGGSNAAFPGRSGRIAFMHLGQIYTVTSHGAKRRQLTRGHREADWPSYSPSGRSIAFSSGQKQSDLWLMRSNGANQRRLTYTKRLDESEPEWSPDGKEIVFAVYRPTSQYDEIGIGLWVVGKDGRGRRQLTSGCDGFPSWSPDGSEIAFTRYDAATDMDSIFVVPAAGGTPTKLSTDPGVSDYEPDWSPDGSQIAFASDPDTFRSNLWVMNADGSDRRQVPNTEDVFVYAPAWSPDGRWIAYEGDDQHSDRIYVSRPDGTGLRVIPPGCEECSLDLNEPSWQPLR